MNCAICACSMCGHMHECSILHDKLEYLHETKQDCIGIATIDCNSFTLYKDFARFNDWNCPIRKDKLGGDSK